MTQLISYVKSQVELDQLDGRELFKIFGTGGLRRAVCGRGVLYSWVEGADPPGLSCQFVMTDSTPAVYDGGEPDPVSVAIDASSKFPCSGIITRTLEGFIMAPALKLEPKKGPNVALLIVSPSDGRHGLSAEKNVLEISNEESKVSVMTGGGELHCIGTISEHSKVARIILNRNPGLPVYRSGFNETLSSLKGRGEIKATWKPVARTFEELVLAFYPSEMSSWGLRSFGFAQVATFSFDRIAANLNAFQDGDLTKSTDYVIGDGPGVNYTLRLVLNHRLRRHAADETKLTVT